MNLQKWALQDKHPFTLTVLVLWGQFMLLPQGGACFMQQKCVLGEQMVSLTGHQIFNLCAVIRNIRSGLIRRNSWWLLLSCDEEDFLTLVQQSTDLLKQINRTWERLRPSPWWNHVISFYWDVGKWLQTTNAHSHVTVGGFHCVWATVCLCGASPPFCQKWSSWTKALWHEGIDVSVVYI